MASLERHGAYHSREGGTYPNGLVYLRLIRPQEIRSRLA